MAIGYLDATATGFRFGEYVGGVFIGVIVTGDNLAYDVNGVPTSGTISSMEFENCNLLDNGATNSVRHIRFKDASVGYLNAYGFDWFDGATSDGTTLTLDVSRAMDLSVGIAIHGVSGVTSTSFAYVNIYGGNQGDKIFGPDDPYFLGSIYGGWGNDKIKAVGLDVKIYGEAGKDRITFDGVNFDINGGWGDDTITVTGVNGRIDGAQNDDTIIGSFSEVPVIFGGQGNDEIHISQLGSGSSYAPVVFGGRGNDVIYGSMDGHASGHEELHGDAGNDEIYLGGAAVNQVDTAYGGSGNDLIVSGNGPGSYFLIGGSGNDTLLGGTSSDNLWGGLGDDILSGGAGSDLILIEGGTDTVLTGTGADIVAIYAPAESSTAHGIVVDFDIAEDKIVIDTSANLSAADTFDLFLDHAVQDGSNVIYDDGDDHILVLEGVTLGDLTVSNFLADFISGAISDPGDVP